VKNLSNIELFNNKYLDSKPTVQADPLIVETVLVDAEILEHCTVQYKYYMDKGAVKGWRVYNYRCNYCSNTVKGTSDFAKHIETCKGLEDDYVPKTRRKNIKGYV
tara:strand:- start:1 stop:315 length:315 start_codon:yes stop_codon:yes gene_type:complete